MGIPKIKRRFQVKMWFRKFLFLVLAASAFLPAVRANDGNTPAESQAARQDQTKTIAATDSTANLDQAQSGSHHDRARSGGSTTSGGESRSKARGGGSRPAQARPA